MRWPVRSASRTWALARRKLAYLVVVLAALLVLAALMGAEAGRTPGPLDYPAF